MKLYIASVKDWGEEELGRALSRLPQALREKALRCRQPLGRNLSTAASLLLDHALFEDQGIRLSQVELETGPYGKPFLAGREEVQFSLSHSGCFAVCALGGSPVGVDVERVNQQKRDYMEIAARFFHEGEYEQLGSSADPAVDFYRLWTLKESYIKFTGEGLHRPLNSFCMELGTPSLLRGAAAPLFAEWDSIPGYRLSLCCEEPGRTEPEWISLS